MSRKVLAYGLGALPHCYRGGAVAANYLIKLDILEKAGRGATGLKALGKVRER
jgi:hypothetical protein